MSVRTFQMWIFVWMAVCTAQRLLFMYFCISWRQLTNLVARYKQIGIATHLNIQSFYHLHDTGVSLSVWWLFTWARKKKGPCSCSTPKFITIFTKFHHWILSLISLIHFTHFLLRLYRKICTVLRIRKEIVVGPKPISEHKAPWRVPVTTYSIYSHLLPLSKGSVLRPQPEDAP
jgi:hypothetical protein